MQKAEVERHLSAESVSENILLGNGMSVHKLKSSNIHLKVGDFLWQMWETLHHAIGEMESTTHPDLWPLLTRWGNMLL